MATNLPTNLDNIRAMLYALTRVNKNACKDVWELDTKHQQYPCPPGVTDCDYGHCKVGSKERCEELSATPYNDETGEDWPTETCTEDSTCLDGKKCIETQDDKGDPIMKCVTPKNYLEWRAPDELHPRGRCVFGNFPLKKWCEHPKHRREGPVPGVTNVPPFRYEKETGQCFITAPYCEYMQVDWDATNQECELSVGDWIGEFFLGKTIFRGIKSAGNVFGENFAGRGVHLYSSKNGIGLDEESLKRAYPNGPSLHSPDKFEQRAAKMVLLASQLKKKAS